MNAACGLGFRAASLRLKFYRCVKSEGTLWAMSINEILGLRFSGLKVT